LSRNFGFFGWFRTLFLLLHAIFFLCVLSLFLKDDFLFLLFIAIDCKHVASKVIITTTEWIIYILLAVG